MSAPRPKPLYYHWLTTIQMTSLGLTVAAQYEGIYDAP